MKTNNKHRFCFVLSLLCLWQIASAQLFLRTLNTTTACPGSPVNLNSLIVTNGSSISWSEKPLAMGISANVNNNVAVLRDGSVTAWGDVSTLTGRNFIDEKPNLTNAKQVACGRSQAYALLDDGTVVGWGTYNTDGNLIIPNFPAPVVQIASAREYGLAVLSNGNVVGWGSNDNGVLNIPTFAAPVVAVAAGREHNLALLSDSTVVGWGSNSDGQITIPNFVLFGGKPVAISAGLNFSVALLSNGAVMCWGANNLNQSPLLFGPLPGISKLASGNGHSIILLNQNNVFGWGDNAAHQLDFPGYAQPILDIAAGSFHSLALLRDGSVRAWGDNVNHRADPYDPLFLGSNPTVAPTQTKTYYVMVEDNNGNREYGSVVVRMESTPPTLNCPSNTVYTNTNCIGTGVNYNVSATDNCTANPTITLVSGLPPGALFLRGKTTNVYKATDIAGNTSTCSFDIIVRNPVPPTITCPAPTTVNIGSGCSERILFNVAVQDNCDLFDATGLTLLGSIGSHDYYVSRNRVRKWSDADADARARRGYLATLTSAAENALVSTIDTRSFIGLIRIAPGSNNFTWVTGEPLTYTNWRNDAPNNLNDNEDFGEIFAGGEWNDIADSPFDGLLRKYIIEVDNSNLSFTVDSTYSVGVTNKVVTFSDDDGNAASCTARITVVDTHKPVINCPAPISVSLSGNTCTSLVNFNVTATDNCSAVVTKTSGLASSSLFPVGTTNNIFTATDPSGNTATCSFTVTVSDNTPPVITCPAPVTVQATGIFSNLCGTLVNYNVTATDNCSATVSQTQGFASGSVFPIGTFTNSFRATDPSGNTATCSFTVRVVDNTPPTISCPNPITVNAQNNLGTCGAFVTYSSPQATDNCVASVTPLAGFASGSIFPIGTTTNTFKATDPSGNSSSCSFTVKVIDNTNPVITCPTPLSKNTDLGVCGAVTTFGTPTVTDNCSANIVQTTGLANGATFPVGVSTITFTATDASNNMSSCSFTVTIIDNEKPKITAPTTVISCTGTGIVLGTPITSDNCGVQTVSNNAPTSYPMGNTTVVWTVTDVNGNTNTATQTVSIAPITNVTPSVINNICNGGNAGSISLAIVGGNVPYTYAWSNGATTAAATGLVSGSYSVTVTSANGCTKTASATIMQPTAIVFGTPSVTNNICNGGNVGKIIIAATGGTGAKTFMISPSVGTQSPAGTFNNLTAGTYAITVKDANNCTKTTMVTVAEPPAIVPTKCYTIVNKKTGQVLDVSLASPWNLAKLVSYTSNGKANQKWRFISVGGGYVKIVAQHSGKVVTNHLGWEGSDCYQYDYETGGAKDWKLECLANGYYKIIHRLSGKALTLDEGLLFGIGADIEVKNFTNSDLQQWQFVETTCPSTVYNLTSKEIADINGHAQATRNVVGFTTNQGFKTDYWTVEKLNNKTETFEKMEIRNNTVLTDEMQYQTFYDNTPDEGENHYRIKQTEVNGAVTYSAIQKIAFSKGQSVNIYPNPASEEAFIDLKPFEGKPVSLVISDMVGKTVQQEVIQKATATPYRLDLTLIPTGLYLVKIQAQGKRVMMRKLQITK